VIPNLGTVGYPTMSQATGKRFASRLVLIACLLFAVGLVTHSLLNWQPADVEAYWAAALRLRSGEPLYAPVVDINAPDVYRYAPWFAALWVPLTYMPRALVEAAWSAALLLASAAATFQLIRVPSVAALSAGALLGSFLIQISSRGNVHPLLIAALVLGVERRSGPLWIAVAASLKAVPLLYVIVYATRRQWRRAIATTVLTGLLIAPMLVVGVAGYTTDPGWSWSAYTVSPALFTVVALASVAGGVAAALHWRPHAWLAMSIAVIFSLPRMFLYDMTFVIVGAARPRASEHPKHQSGGQS
jgi:hypothetical protein